MPNFSRGLRRFLNRLISTLNRLLPREEHIEHVPTLPFQEIEEMECVVLQYDRALYDGYAEQRDGFPDDPEYKTGWNRVMDIEREYGRRLDAYLEPYAGIAGNDLSGIAERRRLRVSQDRNNARRAYCQT